MMHHRDTEITEMELNKTTEQIIGAAIEVHKLQHIRSQRWHPKEDSMTSLCPLCLCGETEVF